MALGTQTTHAVSRADGELVLLRINGNAERAVCRDAGKLAVLEDGTANHAVVGHTEGHSAVLVLCGRSVELGSQQGGIPVGEHLVVGKLGSLLSIDNGLEVTTV